MSIILLIILIVIAGICMGAGVHFIPVGGAPAAMSTATGVGTGTAMLAAGAGMTGLITAASMEGASLGLILVAGGVGAMLMMGITMLFAQFIYVYGVGVVPASAKTQKDFFTGYDQEVYKTPGTEGHGVPTATFISGIIGGLLGGVGGGLAFWAVQEIAMASPVFGTNTAVVLGLSAICAVGLFFINSVLASYNIGGTIEGIFDPKFKRVPTGVVCSIIGSLVIAIFVVLLCGGI